MRAIHGCCHQRGASVSKPFPKLIISSHRKRYEWHENITLEAGRFRRQAKHAEELRAEYAVVRGRCGGAVKARRLPCSRVDVSEPE